MTSQCATVQALTSHYVMEAPSAYIPIDRRQALARGEALPDRVWGAVLFADISGFTPLTEALARTLGSRRGAEELTRQLNAVYDSLIAEVDRYGGSVVGFSGDAITCWFDGDNGQRATACALELHGAMAQFGAVRLPSGGTVTLAMKIAVASGTARRFVVGDPAIQHIDVLAGAALERVAIAGHLAGRAEVLLSPEVGAALGESALIVEWRAGRRESGEPALYPVIGGLMTSVAPTPWPLLAPDALDEEQIRPWLLPAVYARLRAGQDDLLTELRPAVALFLRFSGIDYDADEDAGAKLDSYVRWVQAVLARYDGALLQLSLDDKGTYFYATFGVPIAHEDNARRAVAAALELRALPPELSFIHPVQIGISQGTMRAGACGGVTRRIYGVMGDEVNLAARLMATAVPGQVLVGARVRQEAGPTFTWEALPAIRVKGKAAPVPIFALLSARRQRAIRLQEPAYTLPMIGRQAELAVIAEKLDRTLTGRGQIIGITAEAGMGKSRLVAEVSRQAAARGLIGFAGECQSYGTNSPYFVWQPIWRAFFGLDSESAPDAQIAALEEALAQINPALLPRLPLLGALFNLSIPDTDLTRSLDAQLRKASREALLLECLKAHSLACPTLLVLEDLHWLDPLSHNLLDAIGRTIVNLPVLIVLAYRPFELPRLQAPRVSGLSHFTEINLRELAPEDAERLIHTKLEQILLERAPGPTHAPDLLVQRLLERADGNPFYIEELLNYLRDQGIDPQDPAALAALDLPDSLHSLILSRLDQLSERQQITLKVASVIGRLFRVTWLWGYYPSLGDPRRVLADLEELRRLDLTPLETPEPELAYLFKHVITQEVAYGSLAYATRMTLHEQFAAYLESQGGAAAEQNLDLLAYHYVRSENLAKQREYLLRAGDAAQAIYANETALDYYERLLPLLEDAPERITVLLKLGTVLELIGRWGDAEARYRAALRLAEEVDGHAAQVQCRHAIGVLLRKRGSYIEARAWLESAREGAMTSGDRGGVGYALTELANIARWQGDYADARMLAEVSLILFRELNDGIGLSTALMGMGMAALDQGDYLEGQPLIEESLALFQDLGDRVGMASAYTGLGTAADLRGDYAQSRSWYERSLALARELGDRRGSAIALLNLGNVAAFEGDYEQARAHYAECLALAQELGEKQIVTWAFSNLGGVAALQDRTAAAHAAYTASLALAQELGMKQIIAVSLAGLAWATALQHPARATRLLGAVAALLETLGGVLDSLDRTVYDQALATARSRLDAAAFAAAWAEGQAQTVEQAIAGTLAA
jgi:adenylate cyclase